ncbi:MAG: bifunctional riboflavin kinase/FAD synthetase, partial [Burkholderiales bacterium]
MLTESMVVTHGSLQRARGRCALTIGSFDGVHRGHGTLIDRVIAKGREARLTSCILTFEPHPREFFAGEAAPARLTRLRDKLELLAGAGVEHVHIARFDAKFAALSAPRFIEEVLVRGLGTRWLLVGRDFRFGAGRAGDFSALQGHGFTVEAMPDVQFDGKRVSSSAVRAALKAGNLRDAERLLGHPYTISGRVAHGAKLGK